MRQEGTHKANPSTLMTSADFIARVILTQMEETGTTGHRLHNLGIISDWSRRNFVERLKAGKLPLSEIGAIIDFLEIDLLKCGIIFERIKQGRGAKGVDEDVLGQITVALDREMERLDLTDEHILDERNCRAAGQRLAKGIAEHLEGPAIIPVDETPRRGSVHAFPRN